MRRTRWRAWPWISRVLLYLVGLAVGFVPLALLDVAYSTFRDALWFFFIGCAILGLLLCPIGRLRLRWAGFGILSALFISLCLIIIGLLLAPA